MKNEESTAQGHPLTTPFPTPGRAWGMGVVVGCARAVLTHSLHLKYTCGKRAVSNSSSLYTLFYSVIYNSVCTPKLYTVGCIKFLFFANFKRMNMGYASLGF